ncbi:MAG: 3',5'-cyclic-nucleotide phosphodiesterase [Methylophilales bacterium]|nr:3',5'-cyclic-nucleotide phosphodiesterase [Methylophilales bacterium]
MQIKILGCSGGIGGDLRTTSFLVDDDILIDAGTGASDLSIESLAAIDHIFVTHSHLDHIQCIPLMADTIIGMRDKPVVIHATKDTWNIIKNHVFNWKVWPDFTVIPDAVNPVMVYQEIKMGETVELNGRRFTPIPANHVVPAVGYHIEGEKESMVFTGDTTVCSALWPVVNRIQNLKYLIIEAAFAEEEKWLAELSKHLCPSLLIAELHQLKRAAQIYITHLKPGVGEKIMQQIGQAAPELDAKPLFNQQIFELS